MAEAGGWLHLDLIESLQSLTPEEAERMFLTGSSTGYAGADGHYTDAGNRIVADWIHRGLISRGVLPTVHSTP